MLSNWDCFGIVALGMFPPDKCATKLRYAPTARRHRETGLLRQPPKFRGKEQKPKQPPARDQWRPKVPPKVPQELLICSWRR